MTSGIVVLHHLRENAGMHMREDPHINGGLDGAGVRMTGPHWTT
jgi:hypothetical protein